MRGAAAGAVVGASIGGLVSPAAAHGVGGAQATNFRSEILRIEHPLPGIHVSLVEFGEAFELRNEGSMPVHVLGVDGSVTREIPAGVTRRWHEHAVHWMGTPEPPAVRSAPDVVHVLIPRWELRLAAGGREMVVIGRVLWMPNVSPWPWIAVVGLGLAAVFFALSWAGGSARFPLLRRLIVVATLAKLIVAGTVRAVALVAFDPVRWSDGLWREGAALVGVVALGVALVHAVRRPSSPLRSAAVVGALAMLLSTGLVDVTWWSRPVLPTTLPLWLDRYLIAAVIALAVPVVVMGFRSLLGLSPPGATALPRGDAESDIWVRPQR